VFFSDRGRTRRTAAFDEQHAMPFHVALPPPDLNDQEHRKDYLSSETDRSGERVVGGKLIHQRSTEHGTQSDLSRHQRQATKPINDRAGTDRLTSSRSRTAAEPTRREYERYFYDNGDRLTQARSD